MNLRKNLLKRFRTQTISKFLKSFRTRSTTHFLGSMIFLNLFTSLVLASQFTEQSEYWTGPYFIPKDPQSSIMEGFGEKMKGHNVQQVIFVHGTFVGSDGFGWVQSFSSKMFGKKISFLTDRLKKRILKDTGIYSDEYVNTFCKMIGNQICNGVSSSQFVWSSGNYHLARLIGTFQLIEDISNKITHQHMKRNERILLIGHSHAGQLFALLTQFLANSTQSERLLDFVNQNSKLFQQKNGSRVKEDELDISLLKNQIQNIVNSGVYLDFVTFGAPVRYEWGDFQRYRLLSIINHRGDPNSVTVGGALRVVAGDYVQQWGLGGTDSIFVRSSDQIQADVDLSHILGDNGDFLIMKQKDRKWPLELFRNQKRVPPKSAKNVINVFINYREHQWVKQNPTLLDIKETAITSGFGHGVYTRFKAMEYNTQLIVEKFYNDDAIDFDL